LERAKGVLLGRWAGDQSSGGEGAVVKQGFESGSTHYISWYECGLF